MNERHAYRLIRDLFDHKEAIFGELKRQSSSLGGLGGAAVVGPKARPRAVSSTDESNRRAAMEARQKAIADQRTRDRSPAPASRHKRDRSTDGSMGRFPVVASPHVGAGQGHTPATRSGPSGQGGAHRYSLEVPGSQDSSPVVEKTTKPLPSQVHNTFHSHHNEAATTINGTASMPGAFSEPPTPPEKDAIPLAVEASVEKKDSLKRSTVGSGGRGKHRVGAGSGGTSGMLARGRGSLNERQNLPSGNSPQGVTLEDRPMDD